MTRAQASFPRAEADYYPSRYRAQTPDGHCIASRAGVSLPQRKKRRRLVQIREGRVPGTDIRLGRVVEGAWQHGSGRGATLTGAAERFAHPSKSPAYSRRYFRGFSCGSRANQA